MTSTQVATPPPDNTLCHEPSLVSVSDFGARGDGESDERESIQRALDAGCHKVFVPAGTYRLSGSLRMPSGSWLKAHHQAHFILADEAGVAQDVFLITNENQVEGNSDIRVEGGIWDGNNRRNLRGRDVPDAYTGVGMNFINVQGLEVGDLRMRNAETYFIRGAKLRNFRFTGIEFSTNYSRPNQDGIHIAGESHDGYISGLRGFGPDATRDDLVALVADDSLARAQNLGLCNGPISNVRVERLEAEDCHSFVRLASVFNLIKDIDVEHVRGGCEACAVNMDALRYCAVPLFNDGDGQFPHGAGLCENIRLRDFEVFRSKGHLVNPLVLLESRMRNFRIERFRRDLEKDAASGIPTLRVAHVNQSSLALCGVHPVAAEKAVRSHGSAETHPMPEGSSAPGAVQVAASLNMDSPFVFNGDRFDSLTVNSEGE